MFVRFVGDIHGQIDKMKEALDCDADRIIFCGDFLDSWRRSPEDQIECVKLFLAEAGDRVQAVWGNHELSYCYRDMRCSGWNEKTQLMFNHLRDEYLEKAKPYIYEPEGTLVTHAGLTFGMWKDYNFTVENLEDTLTIWSKDLMSPFYQVGAYRGGPLANSYGGPVWCDISEFEHVPHIHQVFGHSRGKEVRYLNPEDSDTCSVCIDVMENNVEAIFLDRDYEDWGDEDPDVE